jgi:hypothetical protein
MTSPVVFGINSSAARGLNVPGTAALTEPDHLPVPSWVDRTAGMGGKRSLVIGHTGKTARRLCPTSLLCNVGSSYLKSLGWRL